MEKKSSEMSGIDKEWNRWGKKRIEKELSREEKNRAELIKDKD